MLARCGKSQLLAFGSAVAAAILLGGCGGDGSPAGSPPLTETGAASSPSGPGGNKVGYISFAPVTASTWERAHWGPLQAAAAKYNLELSNQEGVSFDEAASVLARLAERTDLVIANSSGYEAAILEVAPRFPDTQFILVDELSTTKGLKNVAGWALNWNQLGYLGGAAGCNAAKTINRSSVGHVSAVPIAALTHFAGGAKDGATANGCKFLITWTNSFTDTAAGRQAALTMIGEGAGAITSVSDAGDEGAAAAAREEGIPFLANYDPTPGVLTTLVVDFERAYDDIGRLWTSGQLESRVYHMTVEDGFLKYATPFSDPSVEKEALAIQEKIESGEIKVDPTHEVKP